VLLYLDDGPLSLCVACVAMTTVEARILVVHIDRLRCMADYHGDFKRCLIILAFQKFDDNTNIIRRSVVMCRTRYSVYLYLFYISFM
jgi:hypothetical protein